MFRGVKRFIGSPKAKPLPTGGPLISTAASAAGRARRDRGAPRSGARSRTGLGGLAPRKKRQPKFTFPSCVALGNERYSGARRACPGLGGGCLSNSLVCTAGTPLLRRNPAHLSEKRPYFPRTHYQPGGKRSTQSPPCCPDLFSREIKVHPLASRVEDRVSILPISPRLGQ